MNASGNICHVGKALIFKEHGNLHAAPTVVAQAGNRLLRIELGQTSGHETHRNSFERKSIGTNASNCQFIRFAHIQHQRLALRLYRVQPLRELAGSYLMNRSHGRTFIKNEIQTARGSCPYAARPYPTVGGYGSRWHLICLPVWHALRVHAPQ